ncbi:hypothetical protein ACFQ3Z_24805 [Streptomyces nogalater]
MTHADCVEAWAAGRESVDATGKQFPVVVQEYIDKPGHDLRVVVVGRAPVVAIQRVSDDWRTNTHLGAEVRRVEVTAVMEKLCDQVVDALGPGFYGVDLVEDRSTGELLVLEVNANPEFARSSARHGVNVVPPRRLRRRDPHGLSRVTRRRSMELFDTATVLARVLTTGVVMSIEKSDRELPGLERLLTKQTGRTRAVLVNSRTAAIHAALAYQGIGHGDTVAVREPDAATGRFLDWLGVGVADRGPAAYDYVSLDSANADRVAELTRTATAPALVVDLTGLGFGGRRRPHRRRPGLGPGRATEDLRRVRPADDVDAGGGRRLPGARGPVQLPAQPLVAACVRMALTQAARPATPTGARS